MKFEGAWDKLERKQTIVVKIFETNSTFLGKLRPTGKVQFLILGGRLSSAQAQSS